MKAFGLLFFCVPLWAQSLQILPAPPSSGGSFQIMLVSPVPHRLAAIQFRLTASKGMMVSGERISIGTSAKEAHKSIVCAQANEKGPATTSFACVLAGGGQPILNGSIVVVRFTAAAPLVSVRISDVLGTTAEAKPVPISGVELTMQTGDPAAK
jgi:hypothetical protein